GTIPRLLRKSPRAPLGSSARYPLRNSRLGFLRSSSLGFLRSGRLGLLGRSTPGLPVGRCRASWHVRTLPPGTLPDELSSLSWVRGACRPKHTRSLATAIDAV